MAKVLFKFGSRAAYDAEVDAGSILNNALYFLEDTNELYKGLYPIGTAHYYFGNRNSDEVDENAIARILGAKTAVLNDVMVITDTDGSKDVFIFAIGADSTENWQKLTGKIHSTDVVFNDGHTLEEKLTSATIAVDNKSIVQDENTGIVSLAGYGESYWAWDGATKEYTLQTVDEQHPWKSGLTPRVYSDEHGNFVIGWYEPNPTTAEGVATDLTALRQDVQSLQTLVGSIGSGSTASTGLVKRIEDVEKLTFFAGDTQIVPVNSKVQIPYFNGTTSGIVRAPSNLTSLMYLDSTGNWTYPQNDLEWTNINE